MRDGNDKTLIKMEGKLYREKQKSLFGLVFFDDKLYYSVYRANYFNSSLNELRLLLICGYCIRLFLSIDMAE